MKKLFFILLAALPLAGFAQPFTAQGLQAENLDPSIRPGESFYDYATGGWQRANPLGPEHAHYATFDKLGEQNTAQVDGLIREQAAANAPRGSIAQKIGTIYAQTMDSTRLNADGGLPLLPFLAEVDALPSKQYLGTMLGNMYRKGNTAFFSGYVHLDDKNTSINIFHITQGGYRLGDRDYYLLDDERSQQIRAKYVEMIEKLFMLSGYTDRQAATAARSILSIETRLARAAYGREKLRDSEANYHIYSLQKLQKLAPQINWADFFRAVGLPALTELDVAQPEPLAEASRVIASSSLDQIKDYLRWSIIRSSASFLSDEYREATFDFYSRTMSGVEQQRPRWKRAVANVNGVLGEAVGQLYVEKYFPPAAKERMLTLVGNLQSALGERIDNLEWMSSETKTKAKEKLATFRVKIGYPDKWRDYSALEIRDEEPLLSNIVRSNIFDMDFMLSKWNQAPDLDEWLMTPQTVNAYYMPTTNEICFPAGILQPPFFNIEADDAVNYGAIGVVIGHEMTHGFDDQGRNFDKNGNMQNWWSPADAEAFNERADKLVTYFDKIIVIDTLHANGRFTLGENIADQGGLQVAWQAFQHTAQARSTETIGGLTPAQRFFLSYANVWAGNIRPEAIADRTKTDPHSLGRWRVDGALPHLNAWYEAFGIKQGDKMYLPESERVLIW